VLQRVTAARVEVDDQIVGEIGPGLLALVGVGIGDVRSNAIELANTIVGLRIFPDDAGKMNRSVLDVAGSVLVVSQFTLLADTSRGRRPSFTAAAPPEVAETLIAEVAAAIAAAGVVVAQGRFGAHMTVSLVNDGPVTIVLEG
jgi:D-tyrosyl-tRNA(Tyr) deacylase